MERVALPRCDPALLAPAVREQVRTVDRSLPVYGVRTMENVVADAIAPRRINLILLAVFAMLALSLVAIGIYGVMSYLVTQRTQEISIRIALGARAADVLRLVLREGVRLAATGVTIGIAAALALTRFLASLLFAVEPNDPAVFASVAVLLIAVSVVACWRPARRAARVDAIVALRHE